MCKGNYAQEPKVSVFKFPENKEQKKNGYKPYQEKIGPQQRIPGKRCLFHWCNSIYTFI